MNRKVITLLCGIFICGFSFGMQNNSRDINNTTDPLMNLDIKRQNLLGDIKSYLAKYYECGVPDSIKQLFLKIDFLQKCRLNFEHKKLDIDAATKILEYNNNLLQTYFETIFLYNESSEIEKSSSLIESVLELTQPLFEQTFIFNISY